MSVILFFFFFNFKVVILGCLLLKYVLIQCLLHFVEVVSGAVLPCHALFNLLFDSPFWVGYHTWPSMQSRVSVFCFVWLAQLGSIIVILSVNGQLVATDLTGDLGVRAPAAVHCVPLALTQEKVLLGLMVTMSMRLNCQWQKLCTCQQVSASRQVQPNFEKQTMQSINMWY